MIPCNSNQELFEKPALAPDGSFQNWGKLIGLQLTDCPEDFYQNFLAAMDKDEIRLFVNYEYQNVCQVQLKPLLDEKILQFAVCQVLSYVPYMCNVACTAKYKIDTLQELTRSQQ